MGRIGMVLIVGGGLWLLGVTTLHAELWRCIGQDGTEMFADKPGEGATCQRYEPRPPLAIVSGSGATYSPTGRSSLAGKKSRSAPSGEDRSRSRSKKDSEGVTSFETIRMLSTGMTRGEVLSQAGTPRYDFKNSRANRWVYVSSDNWIAEVIFSGNRVSGITWTRSRP